MKKLYYKMNLFQKYIFGFLVFVFGFIVGGIISYCSADGIYWESNLGLISVVYNSGNNVLTLQDKNLGATCTDVSLPCSYGYKFQFGNNYPFPSESLPSSSVVSGRPPVDLDDYGPGNYYNSNGIFYSDMSSSNYDLWGGITSTIEAMQGPCPEGYYIIDNWANIMTIFQSLGISNFYNYFKMPLAGYIMYQPGYLGQQGGVGDAGNYWASNSYSSSDGYRINIYDGGYLDWALTENKSYGHSIRCFKSVPVSPTYSWSKLYGDTIEVVSEITVLYNDGDSSTVIQCDGDNIIQINGKSNLGNGNVFTPYIDIDYIDEDNQSLVESYSKSNLYLKGGLFEKTYTGDNDWILTNVSSCPVGDFTGYLPTFDVTGSVSPESTGNVFNNFADNSLKVLLSNIPSYIQYVIIIMLLFFILGIIRRFKRK